MKNKNMVSVMDIEPSNEICDNRPLCDDIEIKSADIQVIPLKVADTDILKKNMRLDLPSPSSLDQIEIRLKSDNNSTSSENENCSANAEKNDSDGQMSNDDEENAKNNNAEFRSPMSPKSPSTQGRFGSRMIPHQNSLTSTIDVGDERRALRDALYQGIFHRHRRTIFAMGSFLRMLKSKNSQYNSIRSSSEGEGEGEEDSTR